MIDLLDGDASFASKFELKIPGLSATFKPHKGKKFVVLMLGEVDAKADTADIEAMLGKLGFVRKSADAKGE